MRELLGPELAEIISAIAADPDDNEYIVKLPEVYTVDLDVTDLMSLVARSANAYYRITRFCGMAKAHVTRAHAAYKYKLTTSYGPGTNKESREAAAAVAAVNEHDIYITVQSVYDMAQSLENAARVNSESARKLLDKVQAMQIATHREQHGMMRDSDFRPY